MDGLLINSEDIITNCVNKLLGKYGRPCISRHIRVQLMGVPDSTNSDTFHEWAQLPIDRDQFKNELSEEFQEQFTTCKPLSGATKLLSDLSCAYNASGQPIELALASSTTTHGFRLKTTRPETGNLLCTFRPERQVFGDDPRIEKGRGKPAPDIYMVALQTLRSGIECDQHQTDINPNECLVFEDSVAGVEAGRRAGMRVIWVPHPDVAMEWRERSKEVLAGRTGTSKIGVEWQLGQIDDGWAECISSLQNFDFNKYGITVRDNNKSTNPM